VWGEATPRSHSHIVSPFGCGWHVDRQAFDRMLAHAAVRSGASLFEGVHLRDSRHGAGPWQLQATEGAARGTREPHVFNATILIDATGQTAQVGRAHGAGRLLLDRLVGIAGHWTGIDPGERGYLLVEAAPEGWWYSAPLPSQSHESQDQLMTMLMTDADVWRQLRLSGRERWQVALQSCHLTPARLGSASPTSAPHAYSAMSHRLQHDPTVDEGPWLAVGDAALAVDPISGSGVVRALRSARAAADAVTDALRHPATWQVRFAAYEAERDEECSAYLFERAAYYASEQRYDTTFWRRRQVWRALRAEPRALASDASAGAGER
jgi:flavin-dependent dehydrogenase